MMEKVRAALFLFLALGLGAAGLLWLKNFSLGKRYHYGAVFRTAGFLGNGDPVSLQGVNVGRIERIEIYTDSVIIRFYTERIRLRKGAYARIENEGVVGNRKLAIYQGKGEFLPEGALIKGEETPTFTDFIFLIDRILQNFEVISAKTDTTLTNANLLLLRTRRDLANLSADLRDLVRSIKSLTENTNAKVDAVSYQMLQISNRLDETVSAVDSFINSEGTIQKLMTEDSLYNELNLTVKELRNLIEDIKSRPERYINLQIRIF
ncbi:MAG: MCE family protein [Thermotogae bacterium]|nr:MCE family protein [Thermotogota bacterium]